VFRQGVLMKLSMESVQSQQIQPYVSGGILKTAPMFWLNLQTRFDLETAEDLLSGRLEKEVRFHDSDAA
jgi:hypothetical protein